MSSATVDPPSSPVLLSAEQVVLRFAERGVAVMKAPLSTVGVRNGAMVIPGNVQRGGWLRHSAASGEQIGTTLVAGHVSDNRDRPGAFGKIRRARKGQVVQVRTPSGKIQRYKVTRTFTQSRSKALPKSLFKTRGKHKLALVTCTGEVTHANGRFHYTKNHVVIAKPVK